MVAAGGLTVISARKVLKPKLFHLAQLVRQSQMVQSVIDSSSMVVP